MSPASSFPRGAGRVLVLGATTAAAVLVLPAPALAWGPAAHEGFARAAIAGQAALAGPLACPAGFDPSRFSRRVRAFLDRAAAGGRERALDAVAGPAATFDARALRGLLGLTRNPRYRVEGIDVLACADGTAPGVLARAANAPDLDGRNLERLLYDADGRPVMGTVGPFPDDPAVLDMGGLEGLSSQAHAHFALASDGLSADPTLLWKDPSRFGVGGSVPGGPFSFGRPMARAHFLLAVIAGADDDPSSRATALSLLGGALHYVQDAADPLHTIQSGSVGVVARGALAFAVRAAATLGGFLGDLPGPVASVADVLSNYHLWVEYFWDARGAGAWAAGVPVPSGPFVPDRAACEAELDRGLAVASRASDAVRPLAGALYGAACDATDGVPGGLFGALPDGGFDPETYVGDAAAAVRVEAIGRESAAVAARASADLAEAFVRLDACRPVVDVAALASDRLLDEILSHGEARAARRDAWRAAHPEGVAPARAVRLPVVAAIELLLVALVAWFVVRRVRKARKVRADRRTAGSPPAG